jgi:hypothetical protein
MPSARTRSRRGKEKTTKISNKTTANNNNKSSNKEGADAGALTTTFFASDGSPLYPSIAISDGFNTVGHVIACMATYHLNDFIGIGFGLVAAASFVGTLRFAFSEKQFAKANAELASMAAFIGLPMIGIANIERMVAVDCNNQNATTIIYLLFLYVFANSIVSDSLKEILTVLVNVFLFVLPVYYEGYLRGSTMEICSISLFVVGAVVIGADREKIFLGMRCENWFHYCLGISAYLMANEFALIMGV